MSMSISRGVRLIPIARALQPRAVVVNSFRRYTTGDGFPGGSDDQASQIAKNPIVQKLSKSPRALESLRKTGEVLRERGYGQSGEKPSVWQQMKLLSDSKVREQLVESM
jgi:hypothetical protein